MQQAIHTVRGPIHASLAIPGSKSISNRALLLAALANGSSEIFNIACCDDTFTFIDGLKQLGIAIHLDELAASCIVAGGDGYFPSHEAKIHCNDAGTAARFLLAACAISPGTHYLDGSPRLRERPLRQLIQVLQQQGAHFTPEGVSSLPLSITGLSALTGGAIDMDGTETSQLLSALLMVAPFADTACQINVQNLVSQPYVDMTCKMMAAFGVMVHRKPTMFTVPVPQRYRARDYSVEPDFSTASYFLAAAAITGGHIELQGLNRSQSLQADARFVSILEKMGCRVHESPQGLHLQGPKELLGIEVDMSDCSDTFLTLAAIAPFAKTPVRITRIGHTRLKESDRITAMQTALQRLNIRVETGADWMQIFPGNPEGGIVDSHGDHRIAMACAVIGLKTPNVIIQHAECVAKTCPEFFKLWSQLKETSSTTVS